MTNPDRWTDARSIDDRTALLWRKVLRAVLHGANAIDRGLRDQLRQVLDLLNERVTDGDFRTRFSAINHHDAYGDSLDIPTPDDPRHFLSSPAQASAPFPAFTPVPPRIAPPPPRSGSTETDRAKEASERLGLKDLRSLLEVSADATHKIIELCAILEGVQAMRSRLPFDQEWDKGLQIVNFIKCASRLMYEIVYGHWPPDPDRAGRIQLVAKEFIRVLQDLWRIEAYTLSAETEDEFNSERHEWGEVRQTGVGRVEPLTVCVLDRKTGMVAARAVVRPSTSRP